MSGRKMVRALFKQRLAAAAEELFGLFERTIAEYEEELCRSKEENERQQKLLDAVWKPGVRLHRADFQQQVITKEGIPSECLEKQNEPQQHIKEDRGDPPAYKCQETMSINKSVLVEVKKDQEQPCMNPKNPVKEAQTDPPAYKCHKNMSSKKSVLVEVKRNQEQTCTSPKRPVKDAQTDPPAYKCHKNMSINKSVLAEVKRDQEQPCTTTKRPVNEVKDAQTDAPEYKCHTNMSSKKRDQEQPCTTLKSPVNEAQTEPPAYKCHKNMSSKKSVLVEIKKDQEQPCMNLKNPVKEAQTDPLEPQSMEEDHEELVLTNNREVSHEQHKWPSPRLREEDTPNPEPPHTQREIWIRPDIIKFPSITTSTTAPVILSNSNLNLTATHVIASHHTEEKEEGEEEEEEGKRFSCPFCSKGFSRKDVLENHIAIHTGLKRFGCSVCGKGFTQRAHLIQHMTHHTGEKRFSCRFCNRNFSWEYQLRKHNCSAAAGGGVHALNLRQHFHDERSRREVQKEPEEAASVSSEHVNLNVTEGQGGIWSFQREERGWCCSVCGNAYKMRASLKRHMASHTGERKFSCSVCRQTFKQKTMLVRHMVLCKGEKRFSCPVCNKNFRMRTHVTDHMNIHTGAKPFSCSVCGKGFTQKANLTRHMVVHTMERNFSCSVCGKTFKQQTVLTAHMAIHTGRYSCLFCAQRFTRDKQLQNHKCAARRASEMNQIRILTAEEEKRRRRDMEPAAGCSTEHPSLQIKEEPDWTSAEVPF